MSRPSYRQQTYEPLRDKTLHNVMRHLFVTEFGYADKVIFAEAMIERILTTIEQFVRPTDLLKPGQMLWMAVAHDGHKHASRRMRDIPQVPVILDLVTDQELQSLSQGQPHAEARRERETRLLKQALDQGGVLAESDLSAILLFSLSRVSHDIKRLERVDGRSLPYRGTVHDAGSTLTHKVAIIKLYEAGHLEPDICRMLSPTHSLEAVTRYVQAYKNVTKLVERGFAPDDIGGILRMSVRLVHAYADILRQHHPEILARNPNFADASTTPA